MAGSWRVARSLDHLLAQINTAYPNRSKAADGSIGDAAHAATVSDHNPDRYGIVRARDYTHDPAHGFDAHAMADALIASRDPRISYVISRGRIASSTIAPWTWRNYEGTNPHNHHAHVSVVSDARADNERDWTITTKGAPNMELTKQNLKDIADAVWAEPVARPGNTPASAGSQLGLANVLSYRNNVLLRAMQGDDAQLIEAVRKAVAEAAPDVDVDALAKSIVVQLVDESQVNS